jgi:hypothetical protein
MLQFFPDERMEQRRVVRVDSNVNALPHQISKRVLVISSNTAGEYIGSWTGFHH